MCKRTNALCPLWGVRLESKPKIDNQSSACAANDITGILAARGFEFVEILDKRRIFDFGRRCEAEPEGIGPVFAVLRPRQRLGAQANRLD
jgi:hypothetical protein